MSEKKSEVRRESGKVAQIDKVWPIVPVPGHEGFVSIGKCQGTIMYQLFGQMSDGSIVHRFGIFSSAEKAIFAYKQVMESGCGEELMIVGNELDRFFSKIECEPSLGVSTILIQFADDYDLAIGMRWTEYEDGGRYELVDANGNVVEGW